MTQNIPFPIAKKIEKKLTIHNDTRIDNYYWLNDRENTEVIDYLNAENEYTKVQMASTETFQAELFVEMKSRIKEDDESIPYKLNGYWYLNKYIVGGEYPIYSRKKETLNAEEQIMFDVNEMAKGHKYYQLGGVSVSKNNQLAAFGVDTVSRRIYTIQFKNLETGDLLKDKIENTTGGCVWSNDNETVFYTRKDKALRAYKIYKHILGTDAKKDVLVYHEKDDTYSCFIYKTKSKKYIIIGSSNSVSDEYRTILADEPNSQFQVFQPRERDLEYSIEHYQDAFYILTNKDESFNYKLMKTDLHQTKKENWTEVIAHNPDVFLENFEIFNDFLVVEERKNGLVQLNIKRWDKAVDYYMNFEEETYTAGIGFNPDFDSKTLRYSYSSLTTPWSTIDFDMETKIKQIKKEQAVLGGKFNKENYITKRILATARDGKKVPVSLVYHKENPPAKETPFLLYAYGSYGSTIDASFSSLRLSLLDRGFTYAIAHIRGGQYLGRLWYDEGKMLYKKNTFNDFVDVSRFLIENNYTSAQHLYAEGGSAGGLLMGAIINQAPELYNGILAGVPFVDVVTTMLDDTIPLTTGEYDEWGNPNEETYYHYIKSYSPYDNVEVKKYPNMLVTTGLHDSQVQYWEPAKWVAKLRELKTGNNLLLLKTDMETGHGGASGRFESLKEVALEYAFLLKLENINE